MPVRLLSSLLAAFAVVFVAYSSLGQGIGRPISDPKIIATVVAHAEAAPPIIATVVARAHAAGVAHVHASPHWVAER